MLDAKAALERLSDDELLSVLELSSGLLSAMIDDVLSERVVSRVSRDGLADERRYARLMETLLD